MPRPPQSHGSPSINSEFMAFFLLSIVDMPMPLPLSNAGSLSDRGSFSSRGSYSHRVTRPQTAVSTTHGASSSTSVIISSNEESSSDDPDHDIDWETYFSGVFLSSPSPSLLSLPPVPAPSPAPLSSPVQMRSLTISSSPPPTFEAPAYDAPASPEPPAYGAPTPTEQVELRTYYQQKFGDLVPPPERLRRSTNRSSKHFAVCKGRRVGVFGDWSIVSPMVTGVSGANYKKWGTFEEAVDAYTVVYRARMIEITNDRA